MSANVYQLRESAGLPASVDAELEVLSAVLVEPTVIARAVNTGIASADFYLERHALLWDAMLALYKSVGIVDEVLLVQALRDAGVWDRFGGAMELSRLLDRAGSSAHLEHYAQIVRDKADVRRIITAGQNIAAAGLTVGVDPGDLYAQAEREMAAVRRGGVSIDDSLASAALGDAFARDVRPSTIPTGIASLDGMIAGLPRGEPTVIGGRPGMGKSSLMLSIIAHHLRLDVPPRVVLFSIEMRRKKVLRILTALVAGVDVSHLIWALNAARPEATPNWSKIKEARERIENAPLWIFEGGAPTADHIVRVCHAIAAKHGSLDIVGIDYWQRMKHEGGSGERKDVAEGRSSGKLCAMSMDLDCAVIELTQLNKAADGQRPSQGAVRECDALNADAGLALFPWRPNRPATGQYLESPEVGEAAEIVIDKCRDGEPGVAQVKWHGGMRRYV